MAKPPFSKHSSAPKSGMKAPSRGGKPAAPGQSRPPHRADTRPARPVDTRKPHAPEARPERKSSAKLAEGRYWMYGRHAVAAALANPQRTIHRLLLTAAGQERLGRIPAGVVVQVVETERLLAVLGEEAVHQGIAAEVSALEGIAIEDVWANAPQEAVVLALDQVTDPHNVGAILRSAAAFGVHAVLYARDHAAAENGALAKAACGALELVPLVPVANLVRALEQLKAQQFWVVGLEGEARLNLHEQKLTGRRVLVLGAEGRGMRRLTGEACDILARLPISPRMESLNVSNAAAIALYELSVGR